MLGAPCAVCTPASAGIRRVLEVFYYGISKDLGLRLACAKVDVSVPTVFRLLGV